MSGPLVAILATLDTKATEADYVARRVRDAGGMPLLVDLGVIGPPGVTPDVSRDEVLAAGGGDLAALLAAPTRGAISPVLVSGAARILAERDVDAVIALGGTQGTSNGCAIMRTLPYGLPKIMVSTVASGDTSSFVDVHDITMMFAVGDLLGLNPFTRRVLANAAGAACGMATVATDPITSRGDRPTIGMTNLGVLTDGAERAVALFDEAGYETIVFHAVGSGGRAMEKMMKDGLVGAVFDYALGELTDEVFGGLRAAGPERLTVAASLGLPQVIAPGGSEHVGVIVEPDTVPERWAGHRYTFHNPIIFVPRPTGEELGEVARAIGARLAQAAPGTPFLWPGGGTSRYAVPGGPLHDPAGDATYLAALRDALPAAVEVVEHEVDAEHETFVADAVARLVARIEAL